MNWGNVKKTGIILMKKWDANYERSVTKLNEEEVIEFHNQALHHLVSTAYEKTPYYKDLFDQASINIKDFDAKDLERLPLLTKDIIRREGPRLLSKDYQQRDPFDRYSGGSTGEPVRIVQDRTFSMRSAVNLQLYYRDFLNMDELAARKLLLWGSERDIFGEKQGISHSVKNRLSRITVLNAFRMTEDDVINYVQTINQVQPELIRSYAGTIYQLSRYINRTGVQVHQPKVIVSTAEMLRPFMRQEIQTAFKTDIYDYYGSREVGGVAGECAHHKMHHILLQNHIEVLDNNNRPVAPGEMGKVVITTLHNHSMPLIRFDIGDTAVLGGSRCACGSIVPFLDSVTGRISDHFILRNGTLVRGGYFTFLIFEKKWVRSFQVIQEDYDRVLFRIILSGKPDKSDIEEIERKVRIVMGPECAIEWEFVDKIDTTASGKHLYVKTLLKQESA
jgi:phenylacetate-CoA ligase